MTAMREITRLMEAVQVSKLKFSSSCVESTRLDQVEQQVAYPSKRKKRHRGQKLGTVCDSHDQKLAVKKYKNINLVKLPKSMFHRASKIGVRIRTVKGHGFANIIRQAHVSTIRIMRQMVNSTNIYVPTAYLKGDT